MPVKLHVYVDEAVREHQAQNVLLVGALVCLQPIAYCPDPWYTELLRHPRSTDAADGRRSAHVIGDVAFDLLRQPAVPGAGLVVVGAGAAAKGQVDPRRWETIVIALLLQIFARARLGPGDAVRLYAHRDRPGERDRSGVLMGIGAALRWLGGPVDAPALEIAGCPEDPSELVGRSFVELALWSLSRGMPPARRPWPEVVRRAAGELGITNRVEISVLPATRDAAALQQWAAWTTGRLDAIDWLAACRANAAVPPRQVKKLLLELPLASRVQPLQRAPEVLGPLAENPGRAMEAGFRVEDVAALLQALVDVSAAGGQPAPSVSRRLAYLAARAATHVGLPQRALKAWRRWEKLQRHEPLCPERLDERLRGLNAQVVIRTDLEDTDAALALLDEQQALITQHLRGFSCLPALGRVHGARSQLWTVARLQPAAVLAEIAAAQAHFPRPEDRSYGWTWTLLALARGAAAPDPAVPARAALDEAAAAGLSPGAHPFFCWGLTEALCVPALAHALSSEWRPHVDAVFRGPGPKGPPPVVALQWRAWGLLTGDAEAFDMALGSAEVSAVWLRTGALMPRIALRSLAAAVEATRGAPRAVQRMRDAQERLRAELQPGAPLPGPGVAAAVAGFLAVDPADPKACAAWRARGGL